MNIKYIQYIFSQMKIHIFHTEGMKLSVKSHRCPSRNQRSPYKSVRSQHWRDGLLPRDLTWADTAYRRETRKQRAETRHWKMP